MGGKNGGREGRREGGREGDDREKTFISGKKNTAMSLFNICSKIKIQKINAM